jgi:Pro-kumamolisin, activation domain/Putative Ig domain
MSRWSRTIALGPCLCLLAGIVVAPAFAATPRQVHVGTAPALPPGAKAVGALASPTPLSVAVTLQPRDPAALAAYATAVSTPGSSDYRDYLTVAQFAQRFGPTSAQIDSVESALRSAGLDPGAASANGLSIPVSATAGQLARAFSIGFHRVSLSGGRSAYANTAAPSLAASVAGYVQGVVGLDTLAVPQPVSLGRAQPHGAARVSTPDVVTGGPQPCSAASAVGGAYTADQIASAYGLSSLYGAGDVGAGETIALYELEPNIPSDITAYQSCFGTDATVSYDQVDGGPGAFASGDGVETDLDVEDVIGLAPAANIVVYQGPDSGSGSFETYNAIISQDRAQVISTSWGECESEEGSSAADAENALFQEAATQGQTIVAAAGDEGTEDCNDPPSGTDTSLAVDDPASQPYVTGVGGTTLSSLGPPPAETVWNDDTSSHECVTVSAKKDVDIPCGGGGGISTLWPMPSYQVDAPASLNVINSSSSGTDCGVASGSYCREVPDVSASADPYEGYAIDYDGTWQSIGGTSGAAPTWAAFAALVNASDACQGKTTVGFLNPILYSLAAGDYAGDFNDITSGNNDIFANPDDLFGAGLGYDMASGLGTPDGSALAPALCGALGSGTTTTPPPMTPTMTATTTTTPTANVPTPTLTVTDPGHQAGTVGKPERLQIRGSASGGATPTYSATGLPAGLSIDTATGLISGTPTEAGSSTVLLSAKDSAGASGQATFSWTIGGLPVASGGSLVGVSRGHPKLSFELAAGRDAPSLEAIVVTLPRGLSFSGNKKRLLEGLTVTGAGGHRLKLTAKLADGVLMITLGSTVTQARVIIAPPALGVSAVLAAKVKRDRVKSLSLALDAIDSADSATRLGLKLGV